MYIDQSKVNVYWPIKDKNARMAMVFFLIEMELNILTIITAMFFISEEWKILVIDVTQYHK
jgi:hypothetical protein